MSTIVQIADAVVAALNAGAFAQPFTAERLFQPVFELADMQRLHVTVVPRSIATQGATRTAGFFDYTVDVGIQRKLDTDTPEEVEHLLTLVEQIADRLRSMRLEGVPAAWLKTENVPVYSAEHLDQLRQFTSVLTVTYRVMK